MSVTRFSKYLYRLLICWVLSNTTVQATVTPEVYQAPVSTAKTPVLKMSWPRLAARNQRIELVKATELPEPSTEHLKPLLNTGGKLKAFQVGIQRDLPELPDWKDWQWQTVSGGQAVRHEFVSAGATGLRVLLQGSTLPAGMEIRFYQPSKQQVLGLFTPKDFYDSQVSQSGLELWSPFVSGNTIGIEIFLPKDVLPSRLHLRIPTLSHLDYDLAQAKFKSATLSSLSSCSLGVACASSDWQETAKAVAQYLFTDEQGDSFMCTGTLLADEDPSDQVPYMITASHCINHQNKANSMEFFWFYRDSSCGAGDATFIQTSGGAELLATRTELDSSLLKLKQSPPSGVVLAAWSLERLKSETRVTALHHTVKRPKVYSSGYFKQFVKATFSSPLFYESTADPQGNFAKVQWNEGVTEPGSSGAGLWIKQDGIAYLKGTLLGGASSCSRPHEPDEFSRLERFYPDIKPWLASDSPTLHAVNNRQLRPQALLDGIMIARYMRGDRGTALIQNLSIDSLNTDIAELEQSLWEMEAYYDIDGNGVVSAEQDGLLLIRYLAGLRRKALIEGITGDGATRNTANVVSSYLDSLIDE
ncbi:MAG: hypothetical protein CR991_01055 [Proteobacteria bacterium]|nr:MAG: hypothetical protein CR991_01055 [Pseudomonadota bacterium]